MTDDVPPDVAAIQNIEAACEKEIRQAWGSVGMIARFLDEARSGSGATIADEVNSLAAWLCFRRALEEVNLAFRAALMGHLAEMPLLIRNAYESASLGWMLAKDPAAAEKWVKKGVWWPDGKVRNWIRESGGPADDYREFYAHASDYAHPTFISTAAFFEELMDPAVPIGVPQPDIEAVRSNVVYVAQTGLFVLHCCRTQLPMSACCLPSFGKRSRSFTRSFPAPRSTFSVIGRPRRSRTRRSPSGCAAPPGSTNASNPIRSACTTCSTARNPTPRDRETDEPSRAGRAVISPASARGDA